MRRFISFLLSAESLLRSRRRWVLAVMTICVCLAVCWTLLSPTYHARTLVDDDRLCPHGFFRKDFGLPPSTDGRVCPHCKPAGAK